MGLSSRLYAELLEAEGNYKKKLSEHAKKGIQIGNYGVEKVRC